MRLHARRAQRSGPAPARVDRAQDACGARATAPAPHHFSRVAAFAPAAGHPALRVAGVEPEEHPEPPPAHDPDRPDDLRPAPELTARMLVLPIPIRLPVERLVVEGLAPQPEEQAAPDGAQRIRDVDPAAVGVTSYPTVTPPAVAIQASQSGSGWSARVQPVTVPALQFTSWYPGPGVHRMRSAAPLFHDFTPEVSSLVRAGEREHVLDFAWANHLALVLPARVINHHAAGAPAAGSTREEATARAEAGVQAALPPPLRWPAAVPAFRHFVAVYGQLASVTAGRDRAGWHSLPGAYVVDPAEHARLGLPRGATLVRYLAGGQIGVHDPETLVRQRFDALPVPP